MASARLGFSARRERHLPTILRCHVPSGNSDDKLRCSGVGTEKKEATGGGQDMGEWRTHTHTRTHAHTHLGRGRGRGRLPLDAPR